MLETKGEDFFQCAWGSVEDQKYWGGKRGKCSNRHWWGESVVGRGRGNGNWVKKGSNRAKRGMVCNWEDW